MCTCSTVQYNTVRHKALYCTTQHYTMSKLNQAEEDAPVDAIDAVGVTVTVAVAVAVAVADSMVIIC